MRAVGAHSENNAERGVILERSEEDLTKQRGVILERSGVPFASSLRSAARG